MILKNDSKSPLLTDTFRLQIKFQQQTIQNEDFIVPYLQDIQ